MYARGRLHVRASSGSGSIPAAPIRDRIRSSEPLLPRPACARQSLTRLLAQLLWTRMGAGTTIRPESAGSLVAGKYRVIRTIADGGMGTVVEAVHEGLGQRVAIKFLLRDLVRKSELVERFLREARAASG